MEEWIVDASCGRIRGRKTENGYEFYVHDLLKIIPYLMNDIPQHHYFVSDDATKLIYVSFENEIYFGECNLSKAEL